MSDGVLIVAGSTGGIGSAIVRSALDRGATVIGIARDAERLASQHDALGIATYSADLCNEQSVAATFERIGTEHGRIAGYAHAVGSITLRPLHALTLEQWNETLNLNVTSVFLALKHLLPMLMKQRGGNIVLYSSVAAQTGLQNHEAIAAAKGAIEGLVRSAAISYSRYGIRINAVAPALTRTALSASLWSSDAMMQASVAMHPLGRIGEAQDIAAATEYLLSAQASWVTGQVLGVDGGLAAGVMPVRAKL